MPYHIQTNISQSKSHLHSQYQLSQLSFKIKMTCIDAFWYMNMPMKNVWWKLPVPVDWLPKEHICIPQSPQIPLLLPPQDLISIPCYIILHTFLQTKFQKNYSFCLCGGPKTCKNKQTKFQKHFLCNLFHY